LGFCFWEGGSAVFCFAFQKKANQCIGTKGGVCLFQVFLVEKKRIKVGVFGVDPRLKQRGGGPTKTLKKTVRNMVFGLGGCGCVFLLGVFFFCFWENFPRWVGRFLGVFFFF